MTLPERVFIRDRSRFRTPHPLTPSPTPHCDAMLRGEGGKERRGLSGSPSPRSGEAAKLERGPGGEVRIACKSCGIRDERALHSRSSRPFSGGERMMREQRGLIGSSDSENPIVLLGPFIVEAVGAEVLIQVWVGFLAAVGTLVLPKSTKEVCLDKYEACMDSPLGNLVVDKHGHSVCHTCWNVCLNKMGQWPLGVILTNRWQSCR
jgi:hypothetical protein